MGVIVLNVAVIHWGLLPPVNATDSSFSAFERSMCLKVVFLQREVSRCVEAPGTGKTHQGVDHRF